MRKLLVLTIVFTFLVQVTGADTIFLKDGRNIFPVKWLGEQKDNFGKPTGKGIFCYKRVTTDKEGANALWKIAAPEFTRVEDDNGKVIEVSTGIATIAQTVADVREERTSNALVTVAVISTLALIVSGVLLIVLIKKK